MDYIRAVVRTTRSRRLRRLTASRRVDVDEIIPLRRSAAGRRRRARRRRPRPAPARRTTTPTCRSATPAPRSSSPRNPTWDGRGVTVGIVDSGITWITRACRPPRTGERKIVDWVTCTDPDRPTTTRPGSTCSDQVSGSDVRLQGRHLHRAGRAAATGSACSTSAIARPRRRGRQRRQSRRQPRRQQRHLRRAVEHRRPTTCTVDTNQNNSFADEAAMTDYKVRYDVGYFGTDNPATAVAERMPFVVQTDGKNKFVNIGIVSGAHGSHVAGIVAGNACSAAR